MTIKGWLHGNVMRLAHRYNWHRTTTLHLENGDVQHRCQWCGLRETLKKDHFWGMAITADARCPRNSVIITNIAVPE